MAPEGVRGPVLAVRPGPVVGGRVSAGRVRVRVDLPGEPGGRPPDAVDRTAPPPGRRGGTAPGTRDASSAGVSGAGVGATAAAGARRSGRDCVLVMTLRMGLPVSAARRIPGGNLRSGILYGAAGRRGKEQRGRVEGREGSPIRVVQAPEGSMRSGGTG